MVELSDRTESLSLSWEHESVRQEELEELAEEREVWVSLLRLQPT